MSIDKFDKEILRRLQKDGKKQNKDLADEIGLSQSPCSRRVKHLEDTNIIREYVALVEPAAVGFPISIYANVALDKQTKESVKHFEDAIMNYPEVMECYLVTGKYDYILRIVAQSIDSYQTFLMDKLTLIEGVKNIQTTITMKPVKYSTSIPL
ncbi:Lrp/AsnC family transcriptional regulator [Aliamphritea hakodatensis]|uniref:Lrp/AsnC family transcriptional regulator n=1 Tax=Aliamphritea hakodatensis TaxID=2895352 RepID=UPI0022FD4ED3|nr:Lrp/AsnC family transcriptional regulator [Aliamphritea hakodatensis]